MKKITFLILGLTLMNSGMFAQRSAAVQSKFTITNPDENRCSTSEAIKIIRDKDPEAFDARKIENEQKLQNWIANNYQVSAKKAVIVIPVVVQIWKNTTSVPDSRVVEQIDRLNADFGRTNTDAGNTPGVFSAVDCEIQFCLANKDAQGNVSTGIVRKTVGGSPDQQGGNDMWDPTKYLNIFVYDISGGILGFTYTPSSTADQAVHIGTPNFGNTGGQYGLGRTASHEVGHWLNLQHIWGDANCGNDFVADTPTQQTSNGGCPSHPSVTCSNSGDMFMNYMDYVDDNCMNAFTAGQKTRMIAAINTWRSGLLSSSATNCSAVIVTPPPSGGPCDSTVANWDWNTETFEAGYWALDVNTSAGATNDGLQLGNNAYDDNGWATKVSDSTSGKELTDVLYVFTNSTGNGAANLKVWDNTGTAGAPGSVLFSSPTTTGAFSANLNQFISLPISPAIAVSNDFYIGYDHDAVPVDGDSLAMGVGVGTSGNQLWAKETGGWLDLTAYGTDAKGTVVAVLCDVATGEKEILGDISQLSIYPNPSIGTFNVALTEKVASTVMVYNMLGELIFSSTKNTQLFTVDMNDQPNGVYFVKVKSGDLLTTKKVILSK
jgi:hypothetical protein